MEGYKAIKDYPIDLAVCLGAESYWDLVEKIINAVAEERKWQCLQDTLNSTNSPFGGPVFIKFPEGGFVFAGLFEKENQFYSKEGFLIHLGSPDDSKRGISTYLFSRLELPQDNGYYERSSTRFYLKDGFLIYREADIYADCADIHDHDHYEISAQAKYHLKTRQFYFPE